MKITEPRVLYFDIETSPNLAYVWGKWEQDVIDFEKEWYMLSFAYKWNESRTMAKSLPDYSSYRRDKTNDRKLVEDLWYLFDQADIIVAHNGDKFDIKKANAKFIEHGMRPPSPYKTVDTVKVARRYFAFNSNKLDDIGKLLGFGRKEQTGGFKLWSGCMVGDRESWSQMVNYNKKDVDLLYNCYHKLKNWMVNHPNMNVYLGTTHNCPTCGSNKTQRRGWNISKTGRYQRHSCLSCGAWSQGEKDKELKVNLK